MVVHTEPDECALSYTAGLISKTRHTQSKQTNKNHNPFSILIKNNNLWWPIENMEDSYKNVWRKPTLCCAPSKPP